MTKEDAKEAIKEAYGNSEYTDEIIKALDQESQTFKWCTDCKEYDQKKHCCHRYSKVIRDTVEEVRQEPVIDKIRAEIVELTKCPYGTECLGANCPSNTDCMICGDHVLEILDKYKAESEVEDGNDDN